MRLSKRSFTWLEEKRSFILSPLSSNRTYGPCGRTCHIWYAYGHGDELARIRRNQDPRNRRMRCKRAGVLSGIGKLHENPSDKEQKPMTYHNMWHAAVNGLFEVSFFHLFPVTMYTVSTIHHSAGYSLSASVIYKRAAVIS